MHVRELQLIGFKSFQEKTTLRFSPGMNSVIGPNGCGKTNVLDALRWVLGEQSFNLLRIAKTEDLIFAGTAKLPPTNYAEVRLVLANDTVPEYGSEVEIRRRYFRTGESEYYLNRQQCRMKDIQDVFLAAGIGTKAYSIFDLNQMREIIAGNIRAMFEEAATLAKYREAKADCQRKMALTDTDLTRLEDIIAERERVVRSLKRQAGRLRSYDKLKQEEKGLRLLELKAEYDATLAELELAEKDAGAMEAAEAERLGEIRRLEEELQKHRGRLRKEQSLKDELAEELAGRRRELDELRNKELLAGQRAELLVRDAERQEKERDELVRQVADLEKVFARTVARLEEETGRYADLEQELEQAREQTKEAEKRLYELRSHNRTVRESVQSLLEKQHEARRGMAKLEARQQNLDETADRLEAEAKELGERIARQDEELEKLAQEANGLSGRAAEARDKSSSLEKRLRETEEERNLVHGELRAAREKRNRLDRELAVLNSQAAERHERLRELLGERMAGEVAGWLDVEHGWERACEAVLQPVMEFVVMSGPPTGGEMRRLVEDGPETLCGLVADGAARSADAPKSDWPGLESHVRCRGETPACIRNAVRSFLVVPDGVDIEAARARYPGAGLCSKQGWAAFPDGRFVVAAREQGRLRQERLVKERARALEEATDVLAGLADREKELERRRVELDRQIEDARAGLAEVERESSLAEARQSAVSGSRSETERDRARVLAELDGVRREKSQVGRELDEMRAGQAELDRKAEHETGLRDRSSRDVEEQEAEARRRLESASERLSGLAEHRQSVARLEAENGFCRRSMEEKRRRAKQLDESAAGDRAKADELGEEREALAPGIGEAESAVAALEERIGGLSVADLARVEEELESNLDELRRTRDKSQGLLMEQRMKSHELARQRDRAVEEARSDYKTDIAGVEADETEDAAARLEQVRHRLESLGQVNPLAAEEFEQERRDLEKLQAQRDDVVQAKENLGRTMEEIDRHARERFVETFREVRHHFRQVFRQMFLEGEADLLLADEANPLESDITITARPRGKNPKRLAQLSDGEKALLAVSLLFAFYRVKPAPFCFLDEIDAPLDDANVGRFADYLKRMAESTQVIIITHNRLTVERAETLFGVTAEQPGVSKLVSVSLAEYRRSEAVAPEETGARVG